MYYNYLLDDKKIYWIVGIVLAFCIFICLLPNKTQQQTTILQVPATSIVGYEPRYFNDEIYSLPNAKMSPYVLFGGNSPNIDYYNTNVQLGYEKLNPTVELIPKTKPIDIYMIQ